MGKATLFVFLDLLFIMLIAALALINPKIDPTLELRPQAVITMSWSDESRSDLDLHLLTPSGRHISYQNKDPDNGVAVLVRDDLGGASLSNGDLVKINEERIELFALEDGIYVVFVREFRKSVDGEEKVEVRLADLSPYKVKAQKVHSFTTTKETHNYFSFRVVSGDIVEVDYQNNRRLQ